MQLFKHHSFFHIYYSKITSLGLPGVETVAVVVIATGASAELVLAGVVVGS